MKREYSIGQEITETIPKSEIAFAFIKPDYLTDLPQIEKILKEHGLTVIYRDQVRLSPHAVDSIYESAKGEHFYQAMKDYLTHNDVIVLLVGGDGLEAQKVLLSLKKANNQDGIIRQQLQRDPKVSDYDLELWRKGQHSRQDELSVVLTQKNVIHTADSTEEAIESLKEILGDKFELLQKRGNLPAELWDMFK